MSYNTRLSAQEYISRLRKHKKECLQPLLECQYGLLDELASVLSEAQLEDVRDGPVGRRAQCEKLIEILCHQTDVSQHEAFIEALGITFQTHIARYLVKDGLVSNDVDDDDIPIPDYVVDKLKSQRSAILSQIHMSAEFLSSLVSAQAISDVHTEHIETRSPAREKCAELLNIVRRRSLRLFKRFLVCLEETKQEHVAKLLNTNLIAPAVEAVLELPPQASGTPRSVMELEEKLLERLHSLPVENQLQLMSEFDKRISLFAAEIKRSIRLYFGCESLESLRHLRHLYESGELRSIVGRLFVKLLYGDPEYVGMKVKILGLVDYCVCEEYLLRRQAAAARNTIQESIVPDMFTVVEKVSLLAIPDITLEQILLKTYMLMSTAVHQVDQIPNQTVYRIITSVCSSWKLAVKRRRWFRDTLRRNLQDTGGFCVKPVSRLDAGNGCVRGVAQLCDNIYIVCRDSNIVRIYCAQTYTRREDFSVTDMKHADDVASCNLSKCLYIPDSTSKAIWRISENKTVERWMKNGAEEMSIMFAYTISTTAQGRVLLIWREPPMLKIYGPDAILVCCMRIPTRFQEPRHAFEKDPDTFLITYGDRGSELHGVCELRMVKPELPAEKILDCRVMRDYGGPCGEGEGRVHHPTHVAVDSSGHVYVVDSQNKRVLVLDSTFSLVKVLTFRDRKGACRQPYRVCCLPDTGRVMVGVRSHFVDVFKMIDLKVPEVSLTDL